MVEGEVKGEEVTLKTSWRRRHVGKGLLERKCWRTTVGAEVTPKDRQRRTRWRRTDCKELREKIKGWTRKHGEEADPTKMRQEMNGQKDVRASNGTREGGVRMTSTRRDDMDTDDFSFC